jgi:SAM-dependent MidA family methyltransferase
LTEEISRIIATHGGAALLIDYGYADVGFGETLQALRNHRFAPILADPGASDLSAHLDFAALGEAARHGGAQVWGPRPQGEFLEGLGIGVRARSLIQAHPSEAESLTKAVARLTAPDQMGNLFQAMALLPASAPPPPGF